MGFKIVKMSNGGAIFSFVVENPIIKNFAITEFVLNKPTFDRVLSFLSGEDSICTIDIEDAENKTI